MLDKEDEMNLVKDNFQAFQEMYRPIYEEKFKDCFELKDGKFAIDEKD